MFHRSQKQKGKNVITWEKVFFFMKETQQTLIDFMGNLNYHKMKREKFEK